MTPAQAAREVAEYHTLQTSWNYDTIEVKVHEAIAQAFRSFADNLETGDSE